MTLAALRKAIPAGFRQMLVTEVTRMKNGMVCVAGIDLDSGAMIRPLQEDGTNWEQGEWVDADYMRVGNILSLEPATAIASAKPHGTDDVRFVSVEKIGMATPGELFAACEETADDDLDAMFNDALVDEKYVVAGTDCRSLGCLVVDGIGVSVSAPFDKVRLSFDDRFGARHHVSVTELDTSEMGDPEVGLAALRQRIAGKARVALRLGLARAWSGTDGSYDPQRCYLQLNGVVVPD